MIAKKTIPAALAFGLLTAQAHARLPDISALTTVNETDRPAETMSARDAFLFACGREPKSGVMVQMMRKVDVSMTLQRGAPINGRGARQQFDRYMNAAKMHLARSLDESYKQTGDFSRSGEFFQKSMHAMGDQFAAQYGMQFRFTPSGLLMRPMEGEECKLPQGYTGAKFDQEINAPTAFSPWVSGPVAP